MGNLDLNGDKKWLEEKFDSIEKKIDYQYSNLNQEIQKLWDIYRNEHQAHIDCREEWIKQMSYLQGTIELKRNEMMQLESDKMDKQRIEDISWRRSERIWGWKLIIVSIVCSVITGVIVVLTRGIFPG
jgi:hypothetical protein